MNTNIIGRIMDMVAGAMIATCVYLFIFMHTAKQTIDCTDQFIGFRIEQCVGQP